MGTRLTSIQLNNDWSNTISNDNCVLCHSQKYDSQPSWEIKPEYKNSEFISSHPTNTLIGHFRYLLLTITNKICTGVRLQSKGVLT